MAEKRVLDEDLVRVYAERGGRTGVAFVYYWGDEVELLVPSQADDPNVRNVQVQLRIPGSATSDVGEIRKRGRAGDYTPLRFRTQPKPHLLEMTCIDVQQGDATLVRMPDRKLLLVDGGEESFVARVLAAAFPGTTADDPLRIDALLITHGDADHFKGLVELDRARHDTRPRACIHARVLRLFHSGLVKLAKRHSDTGTSRTELESFGAFRTVDGESYAVELWDDPRAAPDPNTAFAAWDMALNTLLQGADQDGSGLPVVRRLAAGDGAVFEAFRPDVDIRVLAPLVDTIEGQPALRFLRDRDGDKSASHTINGHSVILRMQYGNVRFLLGGDLNVDGSQRLLAHVDPAELRAEVFKVPHHGSHEYDPEFLAAVAPVVSVVSSGDESVLKEYVHPRANLLAALGRASRGPEPLIFCTELAAFFAYRGLIQPEQHAVAADGTVTPLPAGQQLPAFIAFQRKVFGRVRVRTDGERVLVAVESASDGVKEAYAFRVDPAGAITRDTCSLL